MALVVIIVAGERLRPSRGNANFIDGNSRLYPELENSGVKAHAGGGV
ncbi:hypothetical protein EZH22_02485 [Xanthobacter dioxanivorans]|uniref:Uncharacterized protein n=1 Tax=Xanthobacter dioxanivorans TaxID=2528964 RepID=A0A974SJI9_9HYPH|nr:hypothetical protein [Xanthobacter dioxanivorans]QRG07314.1 hypothetical protein EZH22_02485 [Xanthobacter dioxanivorans]